MDAEDVQTMEQLRQRLFALAGTIRQSLDQFHRAEALPTWTQIHAVQKSLSGHLKQIQNVLGDDEKARFLQLAHVYPTPEMPWSQEGTMTILLRKRLEPDISTWADKARVNGALLERAGNDSMPLRDWETLWNWAAPEANKIVREVMLGMQDASEDEEDEEGEDDDGENKIDVDEEKSVAKSTTGPAMPLDQLLAFAVSGSIPQRRTLPAGIRQSS